MILEIYDNDSLFPFTNNPDQEVAEKPISVQVGRVQAQEEWLATAARWMIDMSRETVNSKSRTDSGPEQRPSKSALLALPST
jgi:hypothetical protein